MERYKGSSDLNITRTWLIKRHRPQLDTSQQLVPVQGYVKIAFLVIQASRFRRSIAAGPDHSWIPGRVQGYVQIAFLSIQASRFRRIIAAGPQKQRENINVSHYFYGQARPAFLPFFLQLGGTGRPLWTTGSHQLFVSSFTFCSTSLQCVNYMLYFQSRDKARYLVLVGKL